MSEQDSGIFLVDKDLGWTSFDVVNKLRFLLKFQRKTKVKVGHAGTLDPLATGLLIVCYGKMTKQIDSFMALTKEYTGEIKLGAVTPSYDRETEESETFPLGSLTENEIAEAARSLTGKQMQRPPDFSAKRVEGRRAYELARKGKETGLRENEIEVLEFETNFTSPDMVSFRVVCSKGTYIRSLAHDLGQRLKCGAYLYSLRRTAIGEHRIENARKISEIEKDFKSEF